MMANWQYDRFKAASDDHDADMSADITGKSIQFNGVYS